MTVLDDLQANREAAEDALQKKVEDLNKSVSPTSGEAVKAPSSRIERYIVGVEGKWEEYEHAHYALKAKLTTNAQSPADCPIAKLKEQFDQLYRVQQDSVDDAHDELDRRKVEEEKVKIAVVPDNTQDNTAQVRRLTSQLKLQEDSIKSSLHIIRESLQAGSVEVQTLHSHSGVLDKESVNIQEVIIPLYNKIVELKTSQNEEEAVEKLRSDYVLQTRDSIMELRILISLAKSKIVTVPTSQPTDGASALHSTSVGSARGGYFGYFNKKNIDEAIDNWGEEVVNEDLELTGAKHGVTDPSSPCQHDETLQPQSLDFTPIKSNTHYIFQNKEPTVGG